jgi:hypothetical protein
VPLSPTDGIYELGGWKYQLVLLEGGTAEERAVGKLSFKGKEVVGSPFARIRTELGEFMWSKSECDQPRWGWYQIDPKKKYARWIRVRIDQSQKGPIWKTVKE